MAHFISSAEFVKSSASVDGCPKEVLPEYAFVGRSNVGKSSLINYLADKKKLAKTSGSPGRTRLINHFIVDEAWYLVDLPGYGYAKISKSEREKFIGIIQQYLLKRQNLTCLFLLIDCRHDPLKKDLNFIRWLGENQIPFAICYTKTDKLSSSQLNKSMKLYRQTLLKDWESLPPIFYSSILQKSGKEEILGFIESTNLQLAQK